MKARHSRLLFLGLALAGSQAGHLLTYQLRFGAAAQQVQSTGAHAYFPALVKTALGAGAGVLIAALFVVGMARVLSARPLRRYLPAPSLLRVLASLFTLQLALFAGQETLESLVAGTQPSSIAVLLLWGMLGQLPVAMVGAAAVRWLAVRLDSATFELSVALDAPRPRLAPAVVPVAMAPASRNVVSSVAASALIERGPPSRISRA